MAQSLKLRGLQARVLPDLTQAPVRSTPGVRGYILRQSEGEISPGALKTDLEAVQRLQRREAQFDAPAPLARPGPSYLPQSQDLRLPEFTILDRALGVALAVVQGTAEHVVSEARKLAGARGLDLAQLRVVVGARASNVHHEKGLRP